jgi:hypothetical protein
MLSSAVSLTAGDRKGGRRLVTALDTPGTTIIEVVDEQVKLPRPPLSY